MKQIVLVTLMVMLLSIWLKETSGPLPAYSNKPEISINVPENAVSTG